MCTSIATHSNRRFLQTGEAFAVRTPVEYLLKCICLLPVSPMCTRPISQCVSQALPARGPAACAEPTSTQLGARPLQQLAKLVPRAPLPGPGLPAVARAWWDTALWRAQAPARCARVARTAAEATAPIGKRAPVFSQACQRNEQNMSAQSGIVSCAAHHQVLSSKPNVRVCVHVQHCLPRRLYNTGNRQHNIRAVHRLRCR